MVLRQAVGHRNGAFHDGAAMHDGRKSRRLGREALHETNNGVVRITPRTWHELR